MKTTQEQSAKDAKEAMRKLQMEVIPETDFGTKKGKPTDRARYISRETAEAAGNVIVGTQRSVINREKEKNKRICQRAHIETIVQRQWGDMNRRMWDEPYKCPMSADVLAMLVTDITGEERLAGSY